MANAPKYRLTYFTGRGRAEPMRLLFADAGIQFEDRRFTDEEWQEKKHSGGYNGKTEEEAYQIDVLCETLEDLIAKVYGIVFGDFDQAYKDRLKESLPKTFIPIHLKFLEKALEENPDGNGYFVGQDITMVEFMYFNFIESVVNMYPDALDDYPKLRTNRELVRSRQKIAAYLSKQIPSYM